MSDRLYRLLVINPGSTSTKIAVYENETEKYNKNIEHPLERLSAMKSFSEQHELRKQNIEQYLQEIGLSIGDFSAIVGRGGVPPLPLRGGGYRVNELLVDAQGNRPVAEHACNLAGIIAFEMAQAAGIPAYTYDSVAVDERDEIAKISGMPEIDRESFCHVLNSRAMGIKEAQAAGVKYNEVNYIIAHLGGGISISLHKQGRIVDLVADDEGPFSPERSGRVPARRLVELCFSGKCDKKIMIAKIRGKGGIIAHLATNSMKDVEDMIARGNKKAELVFMAMAYQVAKGIGELATVVKGNVDCIILTGGIANSRRMTQEIKERVEFIAPVKVLPGENEMEALALGALRILKGEEKALEYRE